MYLPEELKEEDYIYYLDGENILVITDQCENNICNCIKYNRRLNITTEAKQCEPNQELFQINLDQFNSKIDNYALYTIGIFIGITIIFLKIKDGLR